MHDKAYSLSTPTAVTEFIDTLPLNKTLRDVMEKHPELAKKLLPIKIALEWLEGANYQLEQQWGNKTFSQSGMLFMRDASGLQGDNPLQGEDPYLNLNQDITRACDVLNLRRLSRHISTLISRDLLLSMAIPYKNLQEKATRRAKKEGSAGGTAKADKSKPLYEEIKRLFLLEVSKHPGQKLKFYASQIEVHVERFIKQNPEPYRQIGSGPSDARDYNSYILRKLSDINRSMNKK
jgi:hypothetical protein